MRPKAKKKVDRDSREYTRLLEQETLIAEATELVSQLLEKEQVNRQDLARRLGKSKGFVSQVLSGERNMTLRTLSDLAFALNHRFELATAELRSPRRYHQVLPTAPESARGFGAPGSGHELHATIEMLAKAARDLLRDQETAWQTVKPPVPSDPTDEAELEKMAAAADSHEFSMAA